MARPKKAASLEDLRSEVVSALRRTSLRPSISGYRPQAHQEKFHSSQAKGRLFIGGNRSGKTVGGGTESVFWLTKQHPYWQKFTGPIRGRIVAVDFDNGVNKIVLPEIAKWMPPSWLIDGSWEQSYSRSGRTLTLVDGSTVEFMSYDQDTDKFAGTSRHFVWFDEEPPEHIFNECMMRLVDTGGNWWVTMTPVEDMTWTYDGLYMAAKDGKRPDIEVFEVSSTDNQYINGAELEVLMAGLSEEEKNARLHGTYIRHTGAIYKDFINANPKRPTYIPDIVDGPRWQSHFKSRWFHFICMDHGFTNPTAFLFCCADQEGRVVVYDEYYQSKKIVSENAKAVLERMQELGVDFKYIVGDPAICQTDAITGTSVQIEYAEHGISIFPGNNDVSAGIQRVASRLQNGQLFITDRCNNLKWELNRYRWAKYYSKKVAERSNLMEKPLKKDDHAVDALRYGIVSRPALPGEKELPVGNVFNFASVVGETRFADHKQGNFQDYIEQQELFPVGYVDSVLGDDY